MNPVSSGFVVQEDDEYKVILYIIIPELQVQRTSRNYPKNTIINGRYAFIEFKDRSFKFAITVENKRCAMSIGRLRDLIQPKDCLLTYENGCCWITLIKLKPIS